MVHLGGFRPVTPEGGVPNSFGYRRAASCSTSDGLSTSEPAVADVLCTAQAFGVEVDGTASGQVREVRATGQVNDVAHGVLLRLWSRPAPGGTRAGSGPPLRRSPPWGSAQRRGRFGEWSDEHREGSYCHAAGGGVRCLCRSPPLRPWITAGPVHLGCLAPEGEAVGWRCRRGGGLEPGARPGWAGAVLTRAGPRLRSRASSNWASPARESGFGQQKGRPLGRPREAWSHAVRVYRGCLTARA